jgi:hypothetical protein
MANLESVNIEIRYPKEMDAEEIKFIREGIVKFCARHSADARIISKPETSSTEILNESNK